MKNITILSNNARTYSFNTFHIAVFDVVKYHGLRLETIIHNESQYEKI